MMGTVGYMAPEQVRGRPIDSRADLFNFGAVLHEMLCGARAFRGGSPTETGYAILARQPDPLPSTVPRKLRELVRRCLEKDREQRPASAREVLAALDLIGQKPGARKLTLRLPRLHPKLPLFAGALLALCALVVAGLRLRSARVALPDGPPPSGTVAVLPFSARDAPAFGYLAEGMVDLLARDLEGSELRAVDAASVLRAVGGDATAEVDKIRGASAQLGAKYFILGRVEQRRGQLVLEAVLHTAAGEPVSQAVAQGEPGEVLRLVRRLSDQLQLRPLPSKEFETRLAKLVRQTTSSPVALKEWLEGEQLLRRGHWDEVNVAFQRAV
jgi:TolB-like protein